MYSLSIKSDETHQLLFVSVTAFYAPEIHFNNKLRFAINFCLFSRLYLCCVLEYLIQKFHSIVWSKLCQFRDLKTVYSFAEITFIFPGTGTRNTTVGNCHSCRLWTNIRSRRVVGKTEIDPPQNTAIKINSPCEFALSNLCSFRI